MVTFAFHFPHKKSNVKASHSISVNQPFQVSIVNSTSHGVNCMQIKLNVPTHDIATTIQWNLQRAPAKFAQLPTICGHFLFYLFIYFCLLILKSPHLCIEPSFSGILKIKMAAQNRFHCTWKKKTSRQLKKT